MKVSTVIIFIVVLAAAAATVCWLRAKEAPGVEAGKPAVEIVNVPVAPPPPKPPVKPEPTVDELVERKRATLSAALTAKVESMKAEWTAEAEKPLTKLAAELADKLAAEAELMKTRQTIPINKQLRDFSIEQEKIIDKKVDAAKDNPGPPYGYYRTKDGRPDRVKLKAYREQLRTENEKVQADFEKKVRAAAAQEITDFEAAGKAKNDAVVAERRARYDVEIDERVQKHRTELTAELDRQLAAYRDQLEGKTSPPKAAEDIQTVL